MISAAYQGLLPCLDCGKCTGTCPIAREKGGLSPRRIVRRALKGDNTEAAEAAKACLTCGLCDERCPAKIPYIEAVRDLRAELGPTGKIESSSHCGIFETMSKLQTTPGLKPRRLDWVTDDLEIDPESDTLLWIGCTPFFSAYFPDWSEDLEDMARNTVRVLNRIGIKPSVGEEERCCGHDQLWTGDTATFEQLARLNLKWIAKTPATRMVFMCPSCALTFRNDIPERVGPVGKEIVTLPELLAEHKAMLGTGMDDATTVTYHDPCRLGRHSGIYDEPRAVIESLPGVELSEMRRNREGAECCGGGTWTHCDAVTRRVQQRRLEEAADTGGEAMVTACPRCVIHLRCAREGHAEGEPVGPPPVDLAGFVAGRFDANGGAS